MSIENKIPNKENQDRIATALEKIAGSSISDALKAYIDNRVKEKRLEGMPVGYVWVSFSATNPGTIVGGTWSLVEQGRMLLAAGSSYPVESTGGESTHKLTIDEMPRHAHSFEAGWGEQSGDTVVGIGQYTAHLYDWPGEDRRDYQGHDKPHNNMPPYISVYMFRRTA